MSFFGELWSGIKSTASNIWEGTKRIASAAWEGAKRVATKAVGYMADKAESFVGNVVKIWDTVKPYIRPALQIAYDIVTPWPWLKGALIALEKALDWVEKNEKLLVDKLKSALEWTMNVTKRLKEILSGDNEKVIEKSEENDTLFDKVERDVSEEEKKAVELVRLINRFILIRARIQKVFDENSVKDFEHYLRLRATQKLLLLSESVLTESKDIYSIDADDIFMMKIGNDLLSDIPKISDIDLNRLNSIVYARFNKELIPFVFEEMIIAWAKNLVDSKRSWDIGNKQLAKDKSRLSLLESRLKIGNALDAKEQLELLRLQVDLPMLKSTQNELSKSNREMENYVYAAEGFLEVIEGNIKILEGKDYLVEQCSTVGKIIIDCAQHGKKWESLSEDEQELIIDFANIFKTASIERAVSLREVRVEV